MSVSVFPLVSSMFRSGGPTIGLLSQQQDARKRKKRTHRMAGFATQREKKTVVSNHRSQFRVTRHHLSNPRSKPQKLTDALDIVLQNLATKMSAPSQMSHPNNTTPRRERNQEKIDRSKHTDAS